MWAINTKLLTAWYEVHKAAMIADGVEVMLIVGLHDRVQTLNAIYKGSNCTNTGELKDAIANLSKQTKNAVNLTTIHGAKGLEASRVFHIRPDLVPHPKAEKDWEKEQQRNLEFVALTRAKHELFFAPGQLWKTPCFYYRFLLGIQDELERLCHHES